MSHRAADLPLVDLEAEPRNNAELRRGLFETGFFLLRDHVIPRSLLDGVREATLAFMARPEPEKSRMTGPLRGWVGLRAESATAGYGVEDGGEGSSEADACQKYSMGPVVSAEARFADPGTYAGQRGGLYFAENVFPNDEMRTAWENYYRRMDALCARLLEAVRVTLDLPLGTWNEINSVPTSVLRFLDYPDQAGGTRMGAHHDDTLVTVLHQSLPASRFAALQVQLPGEEEWRSVLPRDDVFVVNVGEALTYLSGGRVVATKHRVVGASPDRAEGSARTSLAYFYLPHWKARLRPARVDGVEERPTRFHKYAEPDGSTLFYKGHEQSVEQLIAGGETA